MQISGREALPLYFFNVEGNEDVLRYQISKLSYAIQEPTTYMYIQFGVFCS